MPSIRDLFGAPPDAAESEGSGEFDMDAFFAAADEKIGQTNQAHQTELEAMGVPIMQRAAEAAKNGEPVVPVASDPVEPLTPPIEPPTPEPVAPEPTPSTRASRCLRSSPRTST